MVNFFILVTFPGLLSHVFRNGLRCDFDKYPQLGCPNVTGSICDQASKTCICKQDFPIVIPSPEGMACLKGRQFHQPCYISPQCKIYSSNEHMGCYSAQESLPSPDDTFRNMLLETDFINQFKDLQPLGLCKCKDGYLRVKQNSTVSCVRLKFLNEECFLPDECRDENTNCKDYGNSSRCVCKPDFRLNAKNNKCENATATDDRQRSHKGREKCGRGEFWNELTARCHKKNGRVNGTTLLSVFWTVLSLFAVVLVVVTIVIRTKEDNRRNLILGTSRYDRRVIGIALRLHEQRSGRDSPPFGQDPLPPRFDSVYPNCRMENDDPPSYEEALGMLKVDQPQT